MKRSAIRDRGGDLDHPRHPRHARRLPRFNAVQIPDPGLRVAASGLQALHSLPVARMKRSGIRDRGGNLDHPRHPHHARRLPRFNAVRTPDPGFRVAASGLQRAFMMAGVAGAS